MISGSSFLLVILYIIIMLIELPPMLKNKENKQAVIYFTVMLLALGISLGYLNNQEIPSPAKFIEHVIFMFGKG